MKVTENTSFPEARKRFASFPLGKYADTARRGPVWRLVSAATQVSESDLALPQPPTGLHSAAQPVAAPPGDSAVVAVATNTDGANAAPCVPASWATSTPEGAEEMDGVGPAVAPTLAALPVPPVAFLTPLAAAAKGTRKGARSWDPDQLGTTRTSDDEMDVTPFLSTSQRRERLVTS